MHLARVAVHEDALCMVFQAEHILLTDVYSTYCSGLAALQQLAQPLCRAAGLALMLDDRVCQAYFF
jgi:hypothetical protein